ncbi:MAG: winged helix-turn-helix domain-containing protein [Rhodothermales bacterium]
MDVYIGYLRRKLEEVNCLSTIETARGIGYRYRSAENAVDTQKAGYSK